MNTKTRCKPCRWVCPLILALIVIAVSRRRKAEKQQTRTIDL